jgi:DNA helicase-2/ATP-dependent DNA helicase PcrA
MTQDALSLAIENLTDIQRRAVAWDDGALLVLAGPGSGKTQVLTCRIARLLDSSRDKNFRILALTFTNKAADEMKGRVENFVPGLEERANIGTFHSFCAQVLRQHGVHIGIKPDFAIYALDNDRKALFEDALQRASCEGHPVTSDDVRLLGLIDRMKARLVEPSNAAKVLVRYDDAARIAFAYELYERELKRLNALDFNSLILETHRLGTEFPAIPARYRRSHPYWLIDEFQDTNSAQYRLVKVFSGSEFKNIFSVADDDQIIYQWNGATFKNIQLFLTDFSAELIQLPTNYRCPPIIVEAANRLVVYNAQRSADKKPLIAGKTKLKLPKADHIQLREFATEDDEAQGLAAEIAKRDKSEWGQIAVLGRNRALLERMRAALQNHSVQAMIVQRRDDFLSVEFRWLIASLTQVVRPLDKRNLSTLVEAFNRVGGVECNVDQIITDAETTGVGYFVSWLSVAKESTADAAKVKLIEDIKHLGTDSSKFRSVIEAIIGEYKKSVQNNQSPSDLDEDLGVWAELVGDINSNAGRDIALDQFLQELQLRSKEPSPKADTVALMTVHGAKGREFDYVYLVGMAEDVMPSYQSRQKGDNSPEMEEERRNCFVAITRTKEALILSHAREYRGWRKAPSRFLIEMGLAKAA